jgi:hypothetical protein
MKVETMTNIQVQAIECCHSHANGRLSPAIKWSTSLRSRNYQNSICQLSDVRTEGEAIGESTRFLLVRDSADQYTTFEV